MAFWKRRATELNEQEYLARFVRGPKQSRRHSGSKLAAAGEDVNNYEGQGNAKTKGGEPASSSQSDGSGGTPGEGGA